MRRSSKMNLCGGLGLACLFSGIWLLDAVVLPYTALAQPDLIMRFDSLAIYAAFFGIAVHAVHASAAFGKEAHASTLASRRRRFLAAAFMCGIGLFVIGAAGFETRRLSNIPLGFDGPVPSIFMLFAMKCYGAPATIALVCLFARLNEDESVRTSVCGMFGAFALEAFSSQFRRIGVLSDNAALFLGFGLVIASFLLIITGSNIGDRIADRPQEARWLAREGNEGLRSLFDRTFVVTAILASIMLGFLRGSTTVGNPYTTPLAAIILLVLGILIWRQGSWGLQEILRAAIICTSAGILLIPLLDVFVAEGGETLSAIGTAFFETAVWLLAVNCARACSSMLAGAAGARLITVFGHLAGSVLASLSFQLQSIGIGLQAFSQLLVFAYLMVSVLGFKNPNELLSLRSYFFERDYGDGPSRQPDPRFIPIATPEKPQLSNVGSACGRMDRTSDGYWSVPCTLIVDSFGLTPREGDVLEQLARGRTLGAMAGKFVLSENTVKMHIKHIYQKMDVHSKQEVIDIVEQARDGIPAGRS